MRRRMSREEFDRYEKRCGVIEDLIRKEYPNDTFDFHMKINTFLVEVVINHKSSITLLPDSRWEEIKRHIDKKLTQIHSLNSTECKLCYETIRKNVTCNKCAFNYCGMCYIKLFESGRGVITCPNCRYSFGDTMDDCMLQMGINELEHKLII